jgi:hypothetical protein
MSIGAWEPSAATITLTAARVQRLLKAARQSDAEAFGLTPAEVAEFAPLVRDGGAGSPVDWSALADELDSDDILALVRFFTLAEMRLADWRAGDRSPVIALVALLRRREAVPADLSQWIRGHSDNRFLPYGSLLRRL